MTRKFIGWQVCNRDGENIQGDANDPTGLCSFEVIIPEGATVFAENYPGYLLMPIYEGDIEEPSFVLAPSRRCDYSLKESKDIIEDLLLNVRPKIPLIKALRQAYNDGLEKRHRDLIREIHELESENKRLREKTET